MMTGLIACAAVLALLPAALAQVGVGVGAGEPAMTGPRIRAIGTVQDGGLPHAACSCDRCEAARTDPARKRHVASLAVILPHEDGRERLWLIDVTPDIREQLNMLRDVRDDPAGRVDRNPVDGVLLTHAHLGHYLGLAHFGYESVHTSELPVLCTQRMAAFLRDNGPWDQLVEKREIALREITPGEPVELGAGVTAMAIRVPHRDEYSDTVGYLLRGQRSSILYIPDTEPWDRWERPLIDVLREHQVNTLIVDGTFYSAEELPGRRPETIGHPLMTSTAELLGRIMDRSGIRVLFTHLNHSNPALDPDSQARRDLFAKGFEVLEEGQELEL
ncbi:MAG: MBL fold metallo-hydrolase [Phycisphaerales bacterium JB039]